MEVSDEQPWNETKWDYNEDDEGLDEAPPSDDDASKQGPDQF